MLQSEISFDSITYVSDIGKPDEVLRRLSPLNNIPTFIRLHKTGLSVTADSSEDR